MSAKKIATFISLLITVIILLASCGASKKFKSSTSKKVDSTGTTVNNLVHIKKEAAAGVATKESSSENSFEFTFQEEPKTPPADYTPSRQDPKQVAKELTEGVEAVSLKVKAKGKYSFAVNGNKFESDQPLKTVKLNGKDVTKSVDYFTDNKTDSLIKKDSAAGTKNTTETAVVKAKEYAGFPMYQLAIWIFVIVALVYIVHRVYKKHFA